MKVMQAITFILVLKDMHQIKQQEVIKVAFIQLQQITTQKSNSE